MPGCCVPGCNNHSNKGARLFRFPADPSRRKLWLAYVNRGNWEPACSLVCIKHFEESAFEQHRQDGWQKLKPNAVPTVPIVNFQCTPRRRKVSVTPALPVIKNRMHTLNTKDPTCFNSKHTSLDLQNCSSSRGNDHGPSKTTMASYTTLVVLPYQIPDQSSGDVEVAELKRKLDDAQRRQVELEAAYRIAQGTIRKLQKKVRELETQLSSF
uniref:Putative transposase strongylocentrotus purpuratus: similar to transposase n=1 Tax=Ixodes ricinus TaxID=34613 RepID=A0A0K8RH05_IXORI